MPIESVAKVASIINSGGVALIQVDTIFGLICDGLKDNAIRKIESIKQRNKPSFGFFVRDIDVATKYAKMSELQKKCFQTIFPGYFTLILPASKLALNTLQERTLGNVDGKKTIGLRIPKNDFCLNLLKHFDRPLVATSANISGQKTAKSFKEIDQKIINSVDIIYYDENTKIAGLSSTIIDIVNTNNCKIIRQGSGNISILNKLISFK